MGLPEPKVPEKQHTHCANCGCIVEKADIKWWRWSGWSASGPADSAPAPKNSGQKDSWDYLFHKQCFGEWLENRNGFLQDLDKPMNNCVYFQRTGSSSHGYYVRDGKKHSCFAGWLEADIGGASLWTVMPGDLFTERGDERAGAADKLWFGMRLDHPYMKITISDPKQWLEDFRAFLQKNGWLNAGWFEARKPFMEKTEIADKMRAKYA